MSDPIELGAFEDESSLLCFRARFHRGVLLAGLIVLAAANGAATQGVQPAGWDAKVKLPEAPDRNPDKRIVEVDLEARIANVAIGDDRTVEVWTYNGGIPGPLIHARVGDRLIVHFTNHLPSPTTLHWHGVRVPIAMDGVPSVSQPEVGPGQSFTYDFVLPDAGLYWYHPHVMSAAQVGFGLYGALLVDDPGDGVGVADELVLVLSDIALEENGKLEPPGSGGVAGMVFGREGTSVLVNGRIKPTLLARNGAPQRWRIVNAAKSRHFDLDLDGLTFTKIGGDGGLHEYGQSMDRLNLAAGERADVIVTPTRQNEPELRLRSHPFNRGYGSIEFRDTEELLTIAFADLPLYSGLPLVPVTRSIEPLSAANATPVNIDLTLAALTDGGLFGINGVPFSYRRPLLAAVGETQLWTIKNTTKWSHPMHLHGFFFQVLDDNGAPVRPLEWKDTVNVPFERTLRFLVRFDDRPGDWMYHCHILDHADGGLMGIIGVGTAGAASHLDHSGQPPIR
jgi:FtsP/CotA-like multicopper oxidase with cupredoxin domain